MSYSLFIDDERYPSDHSVRDFVIARSSEESIQIIHKNGCPEFISFDHDLGGDDTAMRVVKWLIDIDINGCFLGLPFIPANFSFDVHSQNPVGAKNIKELLNSYLEFRSKDGNLCI